MKYRLLLCTALAFVLALGAAAQANDKAKEGAAHKEGAKSPDAKEGAAHHAKEGAAHDAKNDAPHEEEHKAGGPLDFKADLAIWTFVVFAILFGVLYKFAWGPISMALDKREHDIAEQIAAAERANEQGKRLMVEYEAKMAQTQDQVRAILDEARRDAEHTQQQILDKARAEAEAEVQRGRREIETATNAALVELAKTSANLAVDLASKILRAQIKAGDHTRLIDEATAALIKSGNVRN